MKRNIIEIDRELCNGCGQCVEACAEGAIQMVQGKAQLVSEIYCDGLGACVGECPTGALRVVERDAPAYDEHATHQHVQALKGASNTGSNAKLTVMDPSHGHGGACPGSAARMPSPAQQPQAPVTINGLPPRVNPPDLQQWPVQLHLVPTRAPFFAGRELVVMATCVPVASADAHWRFLRGRSVVVACPKLDVTDPYVEKLAAIFAQNAIPRVLVTRMEVPCCGGLTRMVTAAAERCGRKDLVVDEVVVALDGSVSTQRTLVGSNV